MRRCLGERSEELINQALPIFNQRYTEYCCVETCIYPGVKTVLNHYQAAGKHMAIATQKAETITQTILKSLGIAPYFEIIIGPETVTHRKPHPESIQRILEKVGTLPERAIMIGDMVSDIQTGKAAGTLTCGVFYGYGSEDEIRAAIPDVALESLTQLLDWIE
jgi:phosphoglycolate phosphatase